MKKYKYIYLEPTGCACPSDGPMWCEDMQVCDNCGKLYIQYIRTDLTIQISKLEELIEECSEDDNYNLARSLQTLIDDNKQ